MSDFKQTLAKQRLRASEAQHARVKTHPVAVQSGNPPISQSLGTAYRYPINQVQLSNTNIVNQGYTHERMPLNQFQTLPPDVLVCFSDGIYRHMMLENGVISYMPVFVDM